MLDFHLGPREAKHKPDTAEIYDTIIIGGGPAGLSAGLYAGRNGLNVLLLEGRVIGGQAAATERIENWPGCHQGTGAEVMNFLRQQAESFGLKVRMEEAREVRLDGPVKLVRVSGGVLRAKTIIVATGAKPVHLGVPGEDRLQNRGVSYCAICDAPFFRDRVVAVVGGGESALKEADFITRFARKVYLIHRRESFRASKATQHRIRHNPKIEILRNTVVEAVLGEEKVSGLRLSNVSTGARFDLQVDGLFVYVGLHPNSELFKGKLRLNGDGYILTDANMATNVPGVFAAGDVRNTPLRQVVTATADGAIAAEAADKYISEYEEEVRAWKASA